MRLKLILGVLAALVALVATVYGQLTGEYWVINLVIKIVNSPLVIALAVLYVGDKYTKIAEQRQLQEKRREKSAAIVDILAEWIRSSYSGEFSAEDRWTLQRTYWKNILWLDKELLDKLLPRLANLKDAPSTNEIIVQTRKILLKLKEPDISENQLNNWLPEPYDPLIEALMKNQDARVRERAAWALGEIGDQKAIEPLTYAASSDEYEMVRSMATEALAKIQAGR